MFPVRTSIFSIWNLNFKTWSCSVFCFFLFLMYTLKTYLVCLIRNKFEVTGKGGYLWTWDMCGSFVDFYVRMYSSV